MNLETEAMRGRLVAKQTEQRRLILKGEGLARTIRQNLNITLTPFIEINMSQVDALFDEMKSAWAEQVVIAESIRQLEQELG